MLKAMNLVTTVRASDIALAAPAASGRMLTLVPWRGRALIGTSQSAPVPSTTPASVTAAEVAAFVAEANAAFPALKLTPEQVSLVHRGIVPASVGRDGQAELLADVGLIEHGATGAYSVLGLKYLVSAGRRGAHRRHCREAPRRPDQGVADGRTRAARRRDRRPRSAGDRDWP